MQMPFKEILGAHLSVTNKKRLTSMGAMAASSMHGENTHPIVKVHDQMAQRGAMAGYAMTSGKDYVADLHFKCAPRKK